MTASSKSKVESLLQGLPMHALSVNIHMPTPTSYRVWGRTNGEQLIGPSTLNMELEAISADYSKEDWGNLMETLTSGKIYLVVK